MPESLHSRAVAKKSLLLRRRVCRTHRTRSGRRCLFALLRLVVLVADQFINDLSSMSFVVSLEISIYLSGQGSQSLLIFLFVRQASRGLSGDAEYPLIPHLLFPSGHSSYRAHTHLESSRVSSNSLPEWAFRVLKGLSAITFAVSSLTLLMDGTFETWISQGGV
ncbi:hypothetical protein BDP81DRAFT_161993 [Colletotrichum phormii]|uniref:Uncharacterized protein n=1 Tax=Colletotrichum phormii TaxID=359342 RepID=A0AAI9ZYS8_9PEZI|nr:uncharacterized protein BDP81DRAFT_161993 [Colletotrichum phormii]KAK1640341.1 hypothetical protein BDP81DRAFT_161993 [Colletotrichum phormii]